MAIDRKLLILGQDDTRQVESDMEKILAILHNAGEYRVVKSIMSPFPYIEVYLDPYWIQGYLSVCIIRDIYESLCNRHLILMKKWFDLGLESSVTEFLSHVERYDGAFKVNKKWLLQNAVGANMAIYLVWHDSDILGVHQTIFGARDSVREHLGHPNTGLGNRAMNMALTASGKNGESYGAIRIEKREVWA